MEAAILIGVVIVWLACAFGCARIAKNKNRSSFVWFLLGLIIGIIGILIIGFMKAKKVDGGADWGDVPEMKSDVEMHEEDE